MYSMFTGSQDTLLKKYGQIAYAITTRCTAALYRHAVAASKDEAAITAEAETRSVLIEGAFTY